jgi:hypothetical protein
MNILYGSNSHLTAEQIDEALIGCLSGDAASHLRACGGCAERVDEARMPLASLKAISTAWSERRSATLPPISIETAARPLRLTWGAAAVTAMLGFVIAIPITQHRERAVEATAVAPQMASMSTPPMVTPVSVPEQGAVQTIIPEDEQITRDNQMLDVIDQELGAPAETSATLAMRPVRGHAGVRNIAATEQD